MKSGCEAEPTISPITFPTHGVRGIYKLKGLPNYTTSPIIITSCVSFVHVPAAAISEAVLASRFLGVFCVYASLPYGITTYVLLYVHIYEFMGYLTTPCELKRLYSFEREMGSS